MSCRRRRQPATEWRPAPGPRDRGDEGSRQRAAASLASAGEGDRFIIVCIARPDGLDDGTWRSTLSRLEELGIYSGESIEKAGSAGPLGAVIVKAGGSRVAVSRDIAASVLVTPHNRC